MTRGFPLQKALEPVLLFRSAIRFGINHPGFSMVLSVQEANPRSRTRMLQHFPGHIHGWGTSHFTSFPWSFGSRLGGKGMPCHFDDTPRATRNWCLDTAGTNAT